MKQETVKQWFSHYPFLYKILKRGRRLYQLCHELPTIIPYKMHYGKALFEHHFKQKTIMIYPELPQSYHLLYGITHVLGYRMTNNPNKRVDLVIAFEDTTVRENDKQLVTLNQRYQVINYQCRDISKRTVDALFENMFGYGISLDPTTHIGIAVKKSNNNAQHNGEVITCPIGCREEGFVYQKLIDTQESDGMVVHYRVAICKQTIPCVYVKYRSITNRFGLQRPSDLKVEIVDVQEIFSQKEVDMILLFCQEIGLDIGDLDMLRDKDDGKLYIVDANNTPAWPPPLTAIRKEEVEKALQKVAFTFENTFWPCPLDTADIPQSTQLRKEL